MEFHPDRVPCRHCQGKGIVTLRPRHKHYEDISPTYTYEVGRDESPHIVYCVLHEEGEWKTACECLHPIIALALRDLLNTMWEQQGKQGELPHQRYISILQNYNTMRALLGTEELALWAEETIKIHQRRKNR